MVYTTISIIIGTYIKYDEMEQYPEHFSLDELREIEEKQEKKDDLSCTDDEVTIYISDVSSFAFQKVKRGLDYRAQICCMDDEKQVGFVYKTLREYKRVYKKCGDCGLYTCCDRCIGNTSNGFYDVEKIYEEAPVTVNMEHLCGQCFHDNKKKFKFCKNCGVHYSKRTNLHKNIDEVEKLLKKEGIATKGKNGVEVYYMLDDCLSCT